MHANTLDKYLNMPLKKKKNRKIALLTKKKNTLKNIVRFFFFSFVSEINICAVPLFSASLYALKCYALANLSR